MMMTPVARLRSLLPPGLLGWTMVFGAWWIATGLNLVDPLFVASPGATAAALIEELSNGRLLRAAIVTTSLALAGFTIGVLLGVPMGLALGGLSWFSSSFRGVIDGIRSVPSAALFPLFLLVFGIGRASKVAIAAFVCMFALCIYTARSVPRANATRRFLLRLHRVPRWRQFLDGMFFPALNGVVGGMSSAVSMALVGTIANEMIVGTDIGLGRYIYEAQLTFRIPQMYAAIIVAGVIGIGLNQAIDGSVRRIVRWRQFDEVD